MNFLLVHGAGEEPAVWEGWQGLAIDLQAGLNVPQASMLNYEAVVACDAALMPRPLCLVGRGMGALAVMLAARRVEPDGLVLVEPWPPAGVESTGEPGAGSAREESPLALDECRRGIPVATLPGRTLVVGSPEVAAFLAADELDADGKKAAAAVVQWAG